MALIRVTNVNVLNNPAHLLDPVQFEITFECVQKLEEDMEWKIIYVGSAKDEQCDQTLDCVLVGPVSVGCHKFVFQADGPSADRIPKDELIGVTAILLTCSYRNDEFIRVGYYVNVDYDTEELRENPPAQPVYERLERNILASKPRVTRFAISWDAPKMDSSAFAPDGSSVDAMETETD